MVAAHARPFLALLLAALMLGGCAPALTPDGAGPLPGQIYHLPSGRLVDEAELLATAAHTDFVLLGEAHHNPEHQRLQARVVTALQRRSDGPRPVAFEMISADQQLNVVEHLAARPRDAAGMAAFTDWSNWAQYEPVVQAALEADAQIVAAGLPGDQTQAVFDRGPAALRRTFVYRTALAEELPAAMAAGLERTLRESHCGDLADDTVAGMMQVQRARDAMLADRLAAVAGNSGAILIAGAEHTRMDRGAPWYLTHLRPGARIVSIAFLEVPEPGTRLTRDLPYDYLWFTSRVASYDPCNGRDPGARS